MKSILSSAYNIQVLHRCVQHVKKIQSLHQRFEPQKNNNICVPEDCDDCEDDEQDKCKLPFYPQNNDDFTPGADMTSYDNLSLWQSSSNAQGNPTPFRACIVLVITRTIINRIDCSSIDSFIRSTRHTSTRYSDPLVALDRLRARWTDLSIFCRWRGGR